VDYQLAVVFVFVVRDDCTAVMVNPQLTDDDVIHERVHFAPRIVVAGLREVNVRRTLAIQNTIITRHNKE